MPRNAGFDPKYEPLRQIDSLQLRTDEPNPKHGTTGPFSFLNPTRAHYRHRAPKRAFKPEEEKVDEDRNLESLPVRDADDDGHKDKDHDQLIDDFDFKWRSRDNRKGRHALVVDPVKRDTQQAKYLAPPPSASFRGICQGLGRMCTVFPYWDISYLVAVIFTLGSVIWVINGFFVFLPLVRPKSEFKDEVYTGGGVTAFVGATVFEVGSVLLMFEAVNENRSGCFGWALEKVVEDYHQRHHSHDDRDASIAEKGDADLMRLRPALDTCRHHHRNKKNLAGRSTIKSIEKKYISSDSSSLANGSPPSQGNGHTSNDPSSSPDQGPEKDVDAGPDRGRSWVWFPSWHELTTHYFREIGFLACLSQFLGATIFWISGFTALPNVINTANIGLADGIYWTPQVVGGTGFIISGTLFMLETQPKWYIPAPRVLGWHIGFWNLIGAIGFTLCGAFGYSSNSGIQYQASCSTFWGGWAFLIGSAIQWYESLDKNPVEEKGEWGT
ncbi:hypothetical protein L228DRAFT_224456 [Xylona heveae TC161]|uniref:Integral membrane protein n=1 Tax=Xylona heveae (strain CBS 132557 / TC161) TaxID=1328760 RepID=A0A165A0S2_XYLHT|nr:hypothetical protein L228DRAFT_224456 [Xylona heveae TC161]KZF19792.1 hypothetical protein L228DRAFT_224456 [Xylona heveae TC161]